MIPNLGSEEGEIDVTNCYNLQLKFLSEDN